MTDSDNKPKKQDAPQAQANPSAQLLQRERIRKGGKEEAHESPIRNAADAWQNYDLHIAPLYRGHMPIPIHRGDIKKESHLGRLQITQKGIYCNLSYGLIEELGIAKQGLRDEKKLINKRDPFLATLLAWYGAKESYKKDHADFSPADEKNLGIVLRITGRDHSTVMHACALCAAMGIPFHCDHGGSNNDELIAKFREQYESYGLTTALRDKPLAEILEIFSDSSKLDALIQEDPKHHKIIRNSKIYQNKNSRKEGQAFLKDLSQDFREVSKELGLITSEQSAKLDPSTVTMDFKQDEKTPEGLTITHRPT